MKVVAAAILFQFASLLPAAAALSHADLAAVSASPPAGARLDMALAVSDVTGATRRIGDWLGPRNGFVAFVDYTCNTLCGTDLLLLSNALLRSHSDPNGYRILVVGIDPKDPPQAARAMERKEIPAALWRDTVLLRPDKAQLAPMTRSLGFHYVYDASIDQFAHPAVVYAIASDGRLRATLSPFSLTTADLGAVFRDSAQPQGLLERVRLLCYAYDPATGLYSLRIVLLLKAAGVATLVALATAVFLWSRRRAA
jgi:protein SCO1/2